MLTPKKRSELDIVLSLIKEGKTKAQIRKKLNLKSTALSNRLRRLEELGNIKLNGKYEIILISSSLKHPKVTKNKFTKNFNKRGHAHNVSVHFNKKILLLDLPKIKQDKKAGILEELKFGSLKLVRKGFTVWINKNNLTIYSNNSYYSDNALHSKFRALREIDNLIQYLISKYDFPKVYGIEVFREHYGLIFNKFAKWLNKKGRKMYVQDKKGKSILWVDKSRKDDIGLEEFEGEDPVTINSADNFFESKEKTGWKDDTPQVEDNKKKIQDHDKVIEHAIGTLGKYDEQISLHLEVEKRKLILTEKQERHLAENNMLFKEILKELRGRNLK